MPSIFKLLCAALLSHAHLRTGLRTGSAAATSNNDTDAPGNGSAAILTNDIAFEVPSIETGAPPAGWISDFERWRFGDSTHDTEVVPYTWERDGRRPHGLWTAPLESLVRCAKSVLTNISASPSSPKSDWRKKKSGFIVKPDFFFTDERVTNFLDSADRIYVICIRCTRVFPTKLKHKVSFLNGRLSDACLDKAGAIFHNVSGLNPPSHWRRATLAHRIAISDAKANNYSLSLVLEEDAFFNNDLDLNVFDFESIVKCFHNSSIVSKNCLFEFSIFL